MAAGCGTQTAAAFFGGSPPDRALTELWDGSSWSESGDLADARSNGGGAGTTTACFMAGADVTSVEEFNGTGWTEVTDVPTATRGSAIAGIQTSAMLAGGYSTKYASEAYEYDGTNWTEVADINTARESVAGFGRSITTFHIAAGNANPNVAQDKTESWDGVSWTELNDLNTARHSLGEDGTNLLALAVGGGTSDTTVEEWTIAQNVKVITD